MLIHYIAYDRTGKKISGTLEAASERTAEDLLWQSDLIVTRVRKVRKLPALHTILPTVFGVKQRDTIALMRQLATLLDSGLPLLLALQAMSHERAHPLIGEALQGVIQFVSEGGQFSDGIERYPHIFPNLFVRLTRIEEQTGDISGVLRRGSDYLESQAEVKSKLRASLTYPAIVSVTAGISVYILLNFSIPMLSGLLEEFNADLPIITKIIVGLSDVVNAYGLYMFALLVMSLIGGFIYRTKTPSGKLVTDKVFLRVPVFGPMILKSSIARLTQTMSSLLASGIPLLEAVELTRDNTENAVLHQSLERTRLDLLSGSSLSDSMAQDAVFPPMLVEVIRVGESAGNLGEQLDVMSRVLQQEFDQSINRMVGFIEPAMILLVGGVVGVIGVTVISTVYSILPSVSG